MQGGRRGPFLEGSRRGSYSDVQGLRLSSSSAPGSAASSRRGSFLHIASGCNTPPQDGLGEYSELPTNEPQEDVRRKSKKRATVLKPLGLEEEPEKSWLAQVLDSNTFQVSVGLLIVGNAVVMGLETDLPDYENWDEIENIFLAIFLTEFLLKCCSQGLRRFLSLSNPDAAWNIFDVIVLSLGISDLCMSIFNERQNSNLATLFRIIRLLRIMRLFRLVRFLRQLYLLAFGFVEAVQAIFWVSLLMLVVLYICSIVMVRTLGSLPAADPHADFLHKEFADIRTSMLTLFVLMSSPNLPYYIGEEGLFWERPLLLAFLVCFIVVGSFGMTALLTGVISESMFEKNQLRAEEVRKEQDELLDALDVKADEVWANLALDANGEATTDDIVTKAMPVIAELFEKAMVEFTDYNLTRLVRLMDADCSGSISCEEFKHAIVTYANGVKPLSIQEVHFNMSCCMHKLGHIEDAVAKVLARLDAKDDNGSSSKASTLADLDPRADRAVGHRISAASTATTETGRRASAADGTGFGLGADLNTVLEPKAGKLSGDSERLRRSLRDLCDCVRECAQRQLDGQREFEVTLQRSILGLRGQVQEDLQAVAANWSDPIWPATGGGTAGLPGEVNSAHKVCSLPPLASCTPAKSEGIKPGKGEAIETGLHEDQFSKL